MDELLKRLRQVIANYKAFIASRANNNPSPAPPQNDRKAVAAYYGSHFCKLVSRFCQQNNQFVQGKVTAQQRNTNQQALQGQIITLLANAQTAFDAALSTEVSIAAAKGLPAPQTQVLFKEIPYPHPNALLAAMTTENNALVVGQTCACTLCPNNQLTPPPPIQVGQVITFAARFNGDATLQTTINPATVTAINPADIAQYNTNLNALAQSLRANPQRTITISVGSNALIAIPNSIFANNIVAALNLRAQRVRTDFINQGVTANRINIVIRPLNGGNNVNNILQTIIITIQ